MNQCIVHIYETELLTSPYNPEQPNPDIGRVRSFELRNE